ncbi:AI-2E family transporter [bacterium]|nr:AI-2E family transporter [bacterium]
MTQPVIDRKGPFLPASLGFLVEIWQIKWVRLAALIASVYALVHVLGSISLILNVLVISLLLAYLFDPIIDRMEKLGMRRVFAIVLLIFGGLFALALVVLLLIPTVANSVSDFIDKVPGYVDSFNSTFVPWVENNFGVHMPRTFEQWIGEFTKNSGAFADIGRRITQPAVKALQNAFTGLAGFINILLAVVIVPVAWFYLLRDIDSIKVRLLNLVPPRWHEEAMDVFGEINRSIANFLRGQLTVCAILGVIYAIGLQFVADLPLGFVVGLFAGAACIVPYLGPILGIGPAVILALVEHGDFTHVLLTAGVFAVGQFLEGNFITPRVMGDKLGLHPVTVIFAIMIGGTWFGLVGMLAAVPAAAVVLVFGRRALEIYMDSAFYIGRPVVSPSEQNE